MCIRSFIVGKLRNERYSRGGERERMVAIYSTLQYKGGGKRLMDGWMDVDKRAEGMDGYSLKTEGKRG